MPKKLEQTAAPTTEGLWWARPHPIPGIAQDGPAALCRVETCEIYCGGNLTLFALDGRFDGEDALAPLSGFDWFGPAEPERIPTAA